jgi:hypothetical protein
MYGDRTVKISASALKTLADGLQASWDDHSFAQTDDNPGWARDRAAIDAARVVLEKED